MTTAELLADASDLAGARRVVVVIEGNPPVLLHNGDDGLLDDAFMYISMTLAHMRRGPWGQPPADVQWLRGRRRDEIDENERDRYEREHRWFCCRQRFKTWRGANQHARHPVRSPSLTHDPKFIPYEQPK